MLSAGMISLLILTSVAGGEDMEAEGEYWESLEGLRSSPVDINSATLKELCGLPGFSPSIAARVISHREKIGRYEETGDLVRYGIISPELYETTAPCLTIPQPRPAPTDDIRFRVRGAGRWSAGGDSQIRLGNYLRVMWKRDEMWRAGLIAARDPGEVRVIDNWKWSILYRKKTGFLRSLAAGNIKYELAMGLLFFSRSRVSKSYLTPGSTGREGRGLRVDLSKTEGYLLRGIGLDLSLPGGIVLTTIVSRAPLDVSRDEYGRVTTIRTSGIHLPTSTADRAGINISVVVAHLEARLGKSGSVGMTFADLWYSEPVLPPIREGNYHSFRGSRRGFLGFDWTFTRFGLGLFGESVSESGRGRGLLLGLERGMGSARWSLLFRDYSPDFAPPLGNPFQDGGGAPANERGLYAGMTVRVNSDMRLSLFVDSYRRLWRRSREPFPPYENEIFVEAKWRPEKSVWVSVRCTDRSGEKAELVGEIVKNRNKLTRKVRLQIDWKEKPIEFRGRYEAVVSKPQDKPHEHGSLLYLDTRFRPFSPLTLNVRVLVFGSVTHSSAVYAYEADLPGVMSVPAFSGTGIRWYLFGKYRPTGEMTISVKFAESVRTPLDSAGDDNSRARVDRSLGLQLDYKY